MQEQKAICTIVTGNVKASAEAYYSTKPSSHFDPLRNQEEDRSSFTTSYSKEMYLLLGLMEQRLIKEIEKIKTIVESLEIQCPSSIENRSVCLCDQKTPGSNLNNSNSERKVKSLSSLLSQKSRFNDNDSDTNTTLFNSNQQYLNVLRYSWKMENFTEHLNLMPFEHSVYSPTFSIRGNSKKKISQSKRFRFEIAISTTIVYHPLIKQINRFVFVLFSIIYIEIIFICN